MTQDPDPPRITRRTLLGSAIAVGAAGSAAGAGTLALFSDSETSSGNTVQAGTLDLQLGSAQKFTLPSGGLSPGEAVQASINLQNNGSLVGDHVEMTFEVTENDLATPTDFEYQTDVSALRLADHLAVETLEYDGQELATQYDIDTVAQLDGRVFDGLGAPDSDKPFTIKVRLAESAGNAFQGDGIDLDCAFGLAQESGQNLFGVARSSLFAHYPLDSVGDGTADDVSGNGHDGTIQTGVSSVPGQVGNAASFAGTSNYITLPSSLNRTTATTVCLWAQTTGDNKEFASMSSTSDSATTAKTFQVDVSGDGNWRFTTTSTGHVLGSISSSGSDHVAVTIDGGEIRGYLNGSQTLSISEPDYDVARFDDPAIGVNRNRSRVFEGVVDDVRFYDRALSPTEIAQLYERYD